MVRVSSSSQARRARASPSSSTPWSCSSAARRIRPSSAPRPTRRWSRRVFQLTGPKGKRCTEILKREELMDDPELRHPVPRESARRDAAWRASTGARVACLAC
ncbi:MAG: hypothetical protein MZV64_17130 [Ignavibacteriales bacterium]|nr:hypothetical protein [Ignavibacteriales bacterium]